MSLQTKLKYFVRATIAICALTVITIIIVIVKLKLNAT